MRQSFKAIGLMSGTSLDGVDVAGCEFFLENGKWSYKIHFAHTFDYPDEWKQKLSTLPFTDALTLVKVHVEYGHFMGQLTRSFMASTGFVPMIIGSHGHTVFHQPSKGLTFQAGLGSAIAAESGIPVICDFRSLDVALGGQGAPLVPIGDRLLFSEYEACLNLGGFANISLEIENKRIAYDICPVNYVLNHLARMIGLPYDPEGQKARSGLVIADLLSKLNNLEYYSLQYPKSLGREWVESQIFPLLSPYSDKVSSLLRTFTEHIVIQVGKAFISNAGGRVIVTGGGVKNRFLMDRIQQLSLNRVIVPDEKLVDYKEALVFAFLGVLRQIGMINVLNSATGSSGDHSGGAVYMAPPDSP